MAESACMDIVRLCSRFRGSVICVRDGAKVHKGIIRSVEINGNAPTVWIIDNNPHRGCVGFRTLLDFTGRTSPWLETTVESRQVADAIIARAELQLGRPYVLLVFNCEHFVTFALGFEPQSKQVWGGLVSGALWPRPSFTLTRSRHATSSGVDGYTPCNVRRSPK
jgi:hypothetical protein